jgi:hypothetical protein
MKSVNKEVKESGCFFKFVCLFLDPHITEPIATLKNILFDVPLNVTLQSTKPVALLQQKNVTFTAADSILSCV